eukprot:1539369-Ditylum_brightwellii.AAC.1
MFSTSKHPNCYTLLLKLSHIYVADPYDFFALTTAEEFLANFTPNERSAAKFGRQEYEVDKTQGKTEAMVIFGTSVIDAF